jgi:hypothetical protein
MAEDARRPQDVGRSHRRRTARPPEVRLLAAAYVALRAELADCIAELRPLPIDPDAPIVFGTPPPKVRPSLADRDRLVQLIARLLAILGAEVEAPGDDQGADSAPTRPARRRRLDLG